MYDQLANTILWGSETFGYGTGVSGNPAIYIFGFPVYLYAIIIVSGMALAILLTAHFFKKRGYDPYDATIYALAVIPFGVLGARLYVFVFPWAGQAADWSTFFDFRSGGLGIYGGVIVGNVAAFAVAKIKKQDFRTVVDCIMPGLFIAQSIGRWGNFANQEAFGNLVTNPNWQFFPYAVYIDARGAWYQATFFYESLATFIGFVVCMLWTRSKRYKLGHLASFYGIYYGVARLFIEGLRSDSLYLWIGSTQTDIKISQLVSIFAILAGVWNLTTIYRKNLHSLYSRLFPSERAEVADSRWILAVVATALVAVSIVMYVLGGESKFIAGFLCDLLAVYCVLGIFAANDRLKLYCNKCGKRNEPQGGVISENDKLFIKFVAFLSAAMALAVFGVAMIAVGAARGIANAVVLGVAAMLASGVSAFVAISSKRKINGEHGVKPNEGVCRCECGETYAPRLNKWLLFIFPYKVYRDFSTANIHEWVDPDKQKRKEKKIVASNADEEQK